MAVGADGFYGRGISALSILEFQPSDFLANGY
jgi:hypothetical protein